MTTDTTTMDDLVARARDDMDAPEQRSPLRFFGCVRAGSMSPATTSKGDQTISVYMELVDPQQSYPDIINGVHTWTKRWKQVICPGLIEIGLMPERKGDTYIPPTDWAGQFLSWEMLPLGSVEGERAFYDDPKTGVRRERKAPRFLARYESEALMEVARAAYMSSIGQADRPARAPQTERAPARNTPLPITNIEIDALYPQKPVARPGAAAPNPALRSAALALLPTLLAAANGTLAGLAQAIDNHPLCKMALRIDDLDVTAYASSHGLV